MPKVNPAVDTHRRSQFAALRGGVVEERATLAADNPNSPRIKPTLPRISILLDELEDRP
jgi:hypothetical protein